jgi:ankyrin repeat protein
MIFLSTELTMENLQYITCLKLIYTLGATDNIPDHTLKKLGIYLQGRVYLENGDIYINNKKQSIRTVLFTASECGNKMYVDICLRMLPEKFKQVYVTEVIRRSARNGHIDIVRSLTKNGFGIDTAMIYAALGGHLELVKSCYKYGARAFNSAMIHAATGGHVHIVKWLYKKERNLSNVAVAAAIAGNIRIIKLLYSWGERYFDLALSYATEKNQIEVMRLLLEYKIKDRDVAEYI